MSIYRVEWIEKQPHWVMVNAETLQEAKEKMLEGEIIEGSQDCEPGHMDKRTIKAEEVIY